MKKTVLFRLSDNDTIYVADLEAGTVGPAGSDVNLATGDTPLMSGVDVALAAKVRSAAASHFLFPSR
jgi:hypothetical protein